MAALGKLAPKLSTLCLLIACMKPVSTIHLTITPERGHINKDGAEMTVTCQANEPIKRCQFNFWKDTAVPEGPLLDLSQGEASPEDKSLLSEAITGYRYSGSGLRTGQCGVRLSLTGWKRYMLGCRVMGETGGWRYAITSFTADQSASIPVTVTPKSVVALPGSDVTILCKAKAPLEWCRFDAPAVFYKHLFFDQGAESEQSTSEHRYHGAGVARGECGVTFSAVTEGLNGYAFCGIVTGPGHWERTGIPVVIARAPGRPILEIASPSFTPGSMMEATCTVDGGRPVANITWYLGDEVLRRDDEDDSPDELWRWPTSLQKVTQRLRRRLLAADDGRELRCEAAHVTSSQPLVARTIISFSTCHPLTSQSVLISCSMAGETTNCSQPQQIGSEARMACKPGYERPATVVYRKITCLRAGTWNHPVFTCHPDCGRRNTNEGHTLISMGKDGKIGEFPWHVGTYQTLPNTGKTIQICGGTLITPTVVVIAAHCFWNTSSETKNPARIYKVAAGKHLRVWDDPDPKVQKRDVKEIVLHELFRGRNTAFAFDIGILRVDVPFDINTKVNLICVDWDNTLERRQLTSGNFGVVSGWGYTEEGTQSDTLKYVDLPFVSSETCLDSLTKPQQVLFTPDKFCAGFVNQSTSVCGGDSGGGLVFRDPGTEKYFLRGIVSVAFKPFEDTSICYSQHFTAFTRVAQYITWILDIV